MYELRNIVIMTNFLSNGEILHFETVNPHIGHTYNNNVYVCIKKFYDKFYDKLHRKVMYLVK
jgi:hypothetical protein